MGKGGNLSPAELDVLLDQIAIEPEQSLRATMWRLVMRQECDPRLTHFLEDWLRAGTKPDGNMALRFLRECRPNACCDLGRTFANHPNPLIRYEAALCLLSSQPRESVAAVIDLYSDLPLDLREEAEMYIEEASGSEELERVRLNASLRGKGNCYELLAQTLESRLASA